MFFLIPTPINTILVFCIAALKQCVCVCVCVYTYISNILCQTCLLYHLENGPINMTYVTMQFPVAQLVEHGVSNAKIMGLIPRESKI